MGKREIFFICIEFIENVRKFLHQIKYLASCLGRLSNGVFIFFLWARGCLLNNKKTGFIIMSFRNLKEIQIKFRIRILHQVYKIKFYRLKVSDAFVGKRFLSIIEESSQKI